MANTVTQRTLYGGGSSKLVVRHIHISSDGSEESDLVIYDNSAFVNDTSKGVLEKIMVAGSSCVVRLEWDQTTDSPAFAMDPAHGGTYEFGCFGGISNPNGAGATGDLLLSTANLDAGDEVSLLIVVRQD